MRTTRYSLPVDKRACIEHILIEGHYQTRLVPSPGLPADIEGNFLPLPKWLPGQPQPADWPPHIHPPRFEKDRIIATVIAHVLTPKGILDGHTRCGKCGYILKGLTEPRCSECGERI